MMFSMRNFYVEVVIYMFVVVLVFKRVVIEFVFFFLFFFFNDTATTEIYTLSLHDALPIWHRPTCQCTSGPRRAYCAPGPDRKSTRLNSSHQIISYAVFCLKKKKKKN